MQVRQPATACPTPGTGENKIGEGPPTGHAEQKIHWSGVIPPRKWMNFYAKVITQLAASPGLTVTVSLAAPVAAESASAKLEDIKSALRELGLDDKIDD